VKACHRLAYRVGSVSKHWPPRRFSRDQKARCQVDLRGLFCRGGCLQTESDLPRFTGRQPILRPESRRRRQLISRGPKNHPDDHRRLQEDAAGVLLAEAEKWLAEGRDREEEIRTEALSDCGHTYENYSGATGIPGRFSEGLLLPRLYSR